MFKLAALLFVCSAARADKLVVVTTDSWTATQGELRRYERSRGRRWVGVGSPVPVVVGKAGLGWGEGLVPARRDLGGPDKKEGDGRTPAGVFALVSAMGYDAAPPPGTTLPYRQATAASRCVDDERSSAYGTLTDAPGDWTSAEVMRRDDDLYRLVVVVGHNPARTPGKGSCIFLHVWGGPTSPTVGCTAMAEPALAVLMGWIDAGTRLVVAPASIARKLAPSL